VVALEAVTVFPSARFRVTAGPGEAVPGTRSTVKLFVNGASGEMLPLLENCIGSLM